MIDDRAARYSAFLELAYALRGENREQIITLAAATRARVQVRNEGRYSARLVLMVR
jgi:hypothetical protein